MENCLIQSIDIDPDILSQIDSTQDTIRAVEEMLAYYRRKLDELVFQAMEDAEERHNANR